jgi:hypothetical protein
VVTKDVLERVVATFVQAFLGIFVVGGDIGNAKAAALAGATAALSLIKGLVAGRFGDGSASAVS